jgi:hypothetical protein
MSIKLLIIFCFLFMTIGATDAYACFCGPGPACEEVWKTSAVFAGRVISVEKLEPAGEKNPYSKTVRLLVEEVFKGGPGSEVVLLQSQSSCDVYFSLGERYLVYANESLIANRLTTNSCTRTRLLSDASEDLAYLRGLSTAANGSTISIDVKHLKRNSEGVGEFIPMKEARLKIESSEQTLNVMTDDSGAIQVKALKPGAYKVSIDLSDGLFVPVKEISVTVADKGCAAVQFVAQWNGRLSGRVTNIQGQPVSKSQISIFPADRGPIGSSIETTQSNEEGYFELKRLPPGKFKLLVRYDGLTRFERPFPKLFFPGVSDLSEAKVIEIREGEKLEDYNVIVPELPRDRTIEGVVVTPDGMPFKEARVLMGFDFTFLQVPLDSLGRFTLQVYEGVSVNLQAYVEIDGRRLQSTVVTVPVHGSSEKIRLVVPPK